MGIFAQSNVEIICKDKESAVKVAEKINKYSMDTEYNEQKFNVPMLNSKAIDCIVVDFEMSSERIQNLEYQCEELWKVIKVIDGVEEMTCPFMVEGDGMSFYQEDDE